MEDGFWVWVMTIEEVAQATKDSPVPFLVLHRVRAGEGNIKAIPCVLSWCYTELGQGSMSHKAVFCSFLGVTPS